MGSVRVWALLLLAAGACAPRVDPNAVAKLATDGTFVIVDETIRTAPRAIKVAADARQRSAQPAAPGAYPAAASAGPPPSQANAYNGTPTYPGTNPPPQVLPETRVVQVRFAGEGGTSRWSLEAAGQELCVTPCTLRYGVGTPIAMHERDATGKPARIAVPYLESGAFDVRARPRRMGAFAPGVVAAAFGGMGAIVGIVLTSVGCPQAKAAMCTGGLVTAGASTALLTGGIVLIAVSGPEIRVEPSPPPSAP